MKTIPAYLWTGLTVALILAGAGRADAQQRASRQTRGSTRSSGASVPAPGDYAAYSRFIANRNIFNPDRYPQVSYLGTPIVRHVTPPTKSDPAFSFVGTMDYEKGMFAFFDGNNENYRKSLQINGEIGSFTVQKISHGQVVLADGTNTLTLKTGTVMRRTRQGTWMLSNEEADFGSMPVSSGSYSGSYSSDSTAATPSESSAAPAAATGQMSDVLKRLMQLRQQENK
jgi:hypothetical protein